MSGYSVFARYYDSLNISYSPQERYDLLRSRLLEKRGEDILDAGCGTGDMCALLARDNYSVIGADISTDMLSIALSKYSALSDRIQFIHQDITKLKLCGKVGAVLCLQDTINHLSSIRDVTRAFKSFADCSTEGAYLFFDANTLYKHREVLSDASFVIENSNLFCVWQSELKDDCSVLHTLDIFERAGPLYKRESCEINEYYYSPEQLEDALAQTGWRVLTREDPENASELSQTSQRILYTAVKE